jgi:hypothetical protein
MNLRTSFSNDSYHRKQHSPHVHIHSCGIPKSPSHFVLLRFQFCGYTRVSSVYLIVRSHLT